MMTIFHLLLSGKLDIYRSDDGFFALHLILCGKFDICRHDELFFLLFT